MHPVEVNLVVGPLYYEENSIIRSANENISADFYLFHFRRSIIHFSILLNSSHSMADALVSIVLERLALVIQQQIQQEVRLVVCAEEDVHKLTNTLRNIRAVLVDAERRQVKDEAVKNWLEDLKGLAYDMDNVLDEWSSSILKLQIQGVDSTLTRKKVCSSIPFPCFPTHGILLRHDIALKIGEIDKRLDVIAQEKDRYNFNLISGIEEPERPRTTSFIDVSEVQGRVEDKDILISKLLCRSSKKTWDPQIVSIAGLGGIGKTTLAQLAYNDVQVRSHFDKRIWVCVSDPFDIMRISRAILEALERKTSTHLHELEIVQQEIQNSIARKKFLLVLDDVWNENYQIWEQLVNCLKGGSPESIILVTTRKMGVARMIGSAYTHPLEELSQKQCRSLFSKIAFFGKTTEDIEELEEIGHKIADKCKGLPLAAKTLGSLLRLKERKEDWINVLNSEVWQLEVFERDLSPALLLSYYDLSPALKCCFSYCAVFPKDHLIKRDNLIKLWMAQSYLSSRNKEMETIGREYFESLAMRSLFQDFGKDNDGNIIECKMHDIVHDFAQFLTKNECLIVEVDDKKDRRLESFYKTGRHSSIVISEFFPTSIFNMENLQTILVVSQGKLHIRKVLPNLFRCLRSLRTLELTNDSIEELPREVARLIHLRYLNLSDNSWLKELPEALCELCNLQTLTLSRCWRLEHLPQGMEKLINLRHLELDSTLISVLPKGIGKLSSLRTLAKIAVADDDHDGNLLKLGGLQNLNNLCGHLAISGLGYVRDTMAAKNAELKNKKHLHHLDLNFYTDKEEAADGMKSVAEALQPYQDLNSLGIYHYNDIKFPSWLTTSLTQLTTLKLEGSTKCTHLPPLGKLPLLEWLNIWGMASLKHVGLEFLGTTSSLSTTTTTTTIAFPKLKKLTFAFMEAWKKWEVNEECHVAVMPCLRSLTVEKCPKLKALPDCLLRMTQLRTLCIYDCPTLKKPRQ